MLRRLLLTTTGVLALATLVAVSADAHVVVSPSTAPKGGTDVSLAFRVANELDNAATVQVDVKFPTAHPIVNVLVEPKPGWTSTVKTTTLAKPIQTDDGTVTQAVSEVTWKGGRIASGQYDDFSVSVGLLPGDTDTLAFPTLQTYSNGSVVSWIDPTVAGAPEPDHPMPTLTLTGAAPPSSSSTATTATAAGSGVQVVAAQATKAQVDAARRRGTIGLAVGVVGLVVAVVALGLAITSRRRPG